MVVIASAASRSSPFGPTPGNRRTSSGARKAASAPSGTNVIPPGLRISEAILHTTLHVATPSDADSLTWSRIACCTIAARCSGSPSASTR